MFPGMMQRLDGGSSVTKRAETLRLLKQPQKNEKNLLVQLEIERKSKLPSKRSLNESKIGLSHFRPRKQSGEDLITIGASHANTGMTLFVT